MVLTKDKKLVLIDKYRAHEKDTGSTEVQVSIITERINQLVEHLKIYKKDQASRRALLILVGQRKRLLNYLNRKSATRYQSLIESLGLRA